MSTNQNVNIEFSVKKWTKLKLDDIQSTLKNIGSYAERTEYIKSYKESINKLFYADVKYLKKPLGTVLTSKGNSESTITLLLGLNTDFQEPDAIRNSMYMVDFGSFLIPEKSSKVIKFCYEKYILHQEPIEEDDLTLIDALIPALVYDRVLHQLDSLEISEKNFYDSKVKIINKQKNLINDQESEFPLSFKALKQSDFYRDLFEELADIQIIDNEKSSLQEIAELLTSVDVKKSKTKIYFAKNNYAISYLLEQHLYKFFNNLDGHTIEESMAFVQLKKINGLSVHIKEKALRNAKSERKNKGKEVSLELRQKIDKIFDSL